MDLKITNLLGEADWKKVARHMESWAHFSREDLSTTQVYYFTALHFLNKTLYSICTVAAPPHNKSFFEHWIQVMSSVAKKLVLSQIVLLGLSTSALLSSIEVVIKYCTFWAQTYQLETLTFVSWTFQIWSLIMIFRMTIDVHHNTKTKKNHKLSTYTGVMKIALHVLIFNKFCSYVKGAKTANFFWLSGLECSY
jgi:hypothetical protein